MDSPATAPAGRRGRVTGEEIEEEDEHHLNPFLATSINKPSASKLQFRKEISRARWDEGMGMGEVIEKKGSMWVTTGIIRNGKLYCHIEEILFLAERGALLLDVDDTSLSIKDIYKKIAEGKYGCSWESFEAYKHLKLLGYIVGRHGLPWTMKNQMICCNNDLPQSTSDIDGKSDREVGESISIIQLLKDMQIDDITPTFDVYLPNSKFRKSSPGVPSFILCLVRRWMMRCLRCVLWILGTLFHFLQVSPLLVVAGFVLLSVFLMDRLTD
ncbi:uncharacterized protein [Elaeis guineensis]|uniref:uncharacterized protein isoform X2 n=1 Tax=Elaeis guineensis var. tenera TaxID=51953 RepID=UPI003C6D7DF9